MAFWSVHTQRVMFLQLPVGYRLTDSDKNALFRPGGCFFFMVGVASSPKTTDQSGKDP